MKVCFIYDSWSQELTLEMYRKMTPNRSGVWKDMVGVTDPKEADYCVILDYTRLDIPPEKAIYISAHPYIGDYGGYRCFDDKKAIAKLDMKYTYGFGEWWLKYDYDYLSKLEPPKKTKDLCCIMSDMSGNQGQTQRKKFIKEFSTIYPVNIYGRIKDIGLGVLGSEDANGGNHCHGKEDVLRDHKYSIEVDTGIAKHYFSERVFDSLLMWCMPLFWGCDNVEDYLPTESFRYIDIYGDGSDIIKFVEEDVRTKHLDDIAKARDLLLNKYQIWARIYETIKAL